MRDDGYYGVCVYGRNNHHKMAVQRPPEAAADSFCVVIIICVKKLRLETDLVH